MPFRPPLSSRSTLALWVLLVLVVFALIGIAAEQVVDRLDSGDRRAVALPPLPPPPPEQAPPPIPPPQPLDPARKLYVDRFAGFAFRPPRGWVEHVGHSYNLAPTQRAMLAYQYNSGGPREEQFAVWISPSQEDTAREIIRRDRRDDKQNDQVAKVRTTRVAGRRVTVRTKFPRSDDCTPCVRATVVLGWDARTSIVFHVFAGSLQAHERHEATMWRMIRSLRPAARDPAADEIEAFLDARVAGRGAKRWLSRNSLEHFRRWGLYLGGEFNQITEDRTGYTVRRLERRGDRVIALVASIGVERFVFGPGVALDGVSRPVVLLKAEIWQAPGTS